MALRQDAWLSSVLGIPAYAAAPGDDAPAAPAFVYAKVDAGDTSGVADLQRRGYSVVDVNVTLARRGSDARGAAGRVEPATPDQHATLLDVAGSCFRYSRFHLDPRFGREAADRVKREWLRSYVDGTRGVELLAAVDGGRPVGFLAVLDADGVRVIDLVGVAPDAQGRGVGTALVAAFVQRHGGDARELRVGTQVANVPSLRLYERLGFSVVAAAYVLHLHVDG